MSPRILIALSLTLAACSGAETGETTPVPEAQEADDEPRSAREMLVEHLDTLVLTVTLRPPDGAPQGLRSVELHVASMRREPHATYEDGSPVSADASITEDDARAIVDALSQLRFFDEAGRYHAERSPEPAEPFPANTEPGPPAPSETPHVRIEATVNDDSWYLHVVDELDWGPRAAADLSVLADALSGEAAAQLGRLSAQLGAESSGATEALPTPIGVQVHLPGENARSYLSVWLEQEAEGWFMTGCVSAVAGSCRGTSRVELSDADMTHIRSARATMIGMPVGCAASRQDGDRELTITFGEESYEGALPADPAQIPARTEGACQTMSALGWWLAERFQRR